MNGNDQRQDSSGLPGLFARNLYSIAVFFQYKGRCENKLTFLHLSFRPFLNPFRSRKLPNSSLLLCFLSVKTPKTDLNLSAKNTMLRISFEMPIYLHADPKSGLTHHFSSRSDPDTIPTHYYAYHRPPRTEWYRASELFQLAVCRT